MKRLVMIMPMLALIFGLTVFLGNAAIKKNSMVESAEWRFTGADPAEPADYTPAVPGTQNDCVKADATICVVMAPNDGDGKPALDEVEGLEEALEEGQEHPNIIKGPYNPQ